jgi:hypothetical protein
VIERRRHRASAERRASRPGSVALSDRRMEAPLGASRRADEASHRGPQCDGLGADRKSSCQDHCDRLMQQTRLTLNATGATAFGLICRLSAWVGLLPPEPGACPDWGLAATRHRHSSDRLKRATALIAAAPPAATAMRRPAHPACPPTGQPPSRARRPAQRVPTQRERPAQAAPQSLAPHRHTASSSAPGTPPV